MKSAIKLLSEQIGALEKSLEAAEKEGDLAKQADLIAQLDDTRHAIAILEPIEAATGAERERWRNGYSRLRDFCIDQGYDLSKTT